MYILTNAEMREADEHTIKNLGVPSLELMERAGDYLAAEAEKLAPSGRIVCVCGGGNNGGDGFVCARLLMQRGKDVTAVFFAEKSSMDCRINQGLFAALGGVIEEKLPTENVALIVDCLFGTGFKGALEGEYAAVVEEMNTLKKQGVKVLSADIPSGINGDNGLKQGVAVTADETLCIGEMKAGALLGEGIDHAGVLKRADIGITLPKTSYATLLETAEVAKILPIRKRNSHKGTFGRAAIVGGSEQYTGAAYLSALACLRSGAGYTTLFVPKNILSFYILKSPEILLKSLNDGGMVEFNEEVFKELLAYDSIAYGMGMGVSEETAKGAAFLLSCYEGKLVLDADGLNSLAAYKSAEIEALFAKKKCDVVLTPHVKEFSRLSGTSVDDILNGGMALVQAFAEKHRVTVLLKNAVTVITNGTQTSVNIRGNSGQAKGGSGDVLSGVIAGLCAVGVSAFNSARIAAFATGRAAEIACEKSSEYFLTATDVISYLGTSFFEIEGAGTR